MISKITFKDGESCGVVVSVTATKVGMLHRIVCDSQNSNNFSKTISLYLYAKGNTSFQILLGNNFYRLWCFWRWLDFPLNITLMKRVSLFTLPQLRKICVYLATYLHRCNVACICFQFLFKFSIVTHKCLDNKVINLIFRNQISANYLFVSLNNF